MGLYQPANVGASVSTFFGYIAYPQCDFTRWNRPVPEPCPTCHAPFLVEKRLKAGLTLQRVRGLQVQAGDGGGHATCGNGKPTMRN